MIPLVLIKLILIIGTAVYLYRDARSRDFSWFMWTLTPIVIIFANNFIVALIAFGLLLLIYLSSRPKGVLKRCPHCEKPVHEVLAFCPYCRKPVKRECISCHETVEWKANRCPNCKSTNLTDS